MRGDKKLGAHVFEGGRGMLGFPQGEHDLHAQGLERLCNGLERRKVP